MRSTRSQRSASSVRDIVNGSDVRARARTILASWDSLRSGEEGL